MVQVEGPRPEVSTLRPNLVGDVCPLRCAANLYAERLDGRRPRLSVDQYGLQQLWRSAVFQRGSTGFGEMSTNAHIDGAVR